MPEYAAYMKLTPEHLANRRRALTDAVVRAGYDAQFSTPLGSEIFNAFCEGRTTLDEALARISKVNLPH